MIKWDTTKQVQYHNIIAPLLIKLVQRKNGTEYVPDWWYGRGYSFGEEYFECMICHQRMLNIETYQHGYQHLKEHGLLPFL